MKSRKKKIRHVFFYSAFFILSALLQIVRAEQLPFKNYTTAEGLGHDRVDEIVRDSRGFLWFCTGEGLSRFDGYEFKIYTQADGLPHRRVTDLIETRDGKYLVATYAGLAVFNPFGVPRRWNDVESRQETPPNSTEPPMFSVLRPPDAKQHKKSWTVTDLLEDREGRIWAATFDGLYRLENIGDEWRFHLIQNEEWEGKGFEFHALLEDRFGALWIATGNGLFRQTPDGKIENLKEMQGGLSMLEDRYGRIWVGGGGGVSGLSVAEFPDGQNKPVLSRIYTMKDGLTEVSWINDIIETSDGRILIGVANGICEFLPEAKGDEPKFRVLLRKDVISLVEDNDSNIWVGTSENGAIKMAQHGFTIFDERDFPKSALTGFGSIFSGSGDEIFVSVGLNQLLRFDGKIFSVAAPQGMKLRSWGWNQIDFRSRTGEWWFGNGSEILRFPNVGFEELQKTKPLAVYNYLEQAGIKIGGSFRLFEDSRGDVWVSFNADAVVSDSASSMLRWERAADKPHIYQPAKHGLPIGNGPTAFAEDAAGNVWIGYYFGGLVRYRHGRFEMFTNTEGMPSGIVNAIYRDRANRLWIATGSNGVVRVDNPTDEKPHLQNLTTADGLSSNQAACLTEDNFGRIYIGTGRGVTRIEPETGRIKIYSQADGLPRSYVRICGRSENGALWFTQSNALARLIPTAEEASAPPPVFIGSVRVNGETARKISELGETNVANLDFASDQRQVQIDFLALGFGTAETLRYQHKLDGIDSDWSEPTTLRTVSLNLSPGSYNFQVRAVNSEGVASENPASVSFSIARPFWQHWWFLVLAALVFSGIFYAVYRYRIAQIIKLERVRTRIATDLHDDIGSSLSQIAILSEVVRQKVGDNGANEPLNLIADTSREMVDSMSDIVWAINPQKDHLSDLVQRMRRFASDILDAKDVLYRFHLAEKSSDVALGADIRREVYLMFKECLNNLVKYSEASEVDLSVEVEDNALVISVKDNGKGFDTEEKLNGNYDGFGGNGLINMRRRAKNLGGTFEIDSEPKRGTNITMKIPLSEKSWLSSSTGKK